MYSITNHPETYCGDQETNEIETTYSISIQQIENSLSNALNLSVCSNNLNLGDSRPLSLNL